MRYHETTLTEKELPIPLTLKAEKQIFRTSKQWKTTFIILSVIFLLSTLWIGLNIKIPLMFLIMSIIVAFLGLLIIYFVVTSRTLYFEETKVVYSTVSKTLYIPFKQIRSLSVTHSLEGFGTVLINGGDAYSRIRFWCITDPEIVEQLFVKQLSEID